MAAARRGGTSVAQHVSAGNRGHFIAESLQGRHKTGHSNKLVPFCAVLRTHLDFQIRTQD